MASPAVLPQNDKNPGARLASLANARESYEWSHEALPPLATLAELPPEAHFDTRYNVLQLETMSRIAANMAEVEVRDALEPFQGLSEYESLYPQLPKPRGLQGFLHDKSFARQRLAGPNPMVLRRCDPSDLLALGLPGETLATLCGFSDPDAASLSGRLFVADYRFFATLPCGTHAGRPKSVAPALALFCWRDDGLRDRGALRPVAIRLREDLPPVTPADGARWQAAKTHVQVADANHHEMSTHLGRTHLVLEPFAIATARNFAPNHPLALLLRPHLRFSLARNVLARETLLKPDGSADRLLAGTLAASIGLATQAARTWDFEAFKLPNELKRRGVDDPNALPDFPYRDDALLLWDAIGSFTSAYVSLYYASPGDVAADNELQAWLQELRSPDAGRVSGLPSALTTPADIAEVMRQILFTSGPQHSAVNYPQWDFMGAPSNMPLAAYASPTALPSADADTQAALLPILPPRDQTRDQIEVIRFLSGFQYDRLGDYPKNLFQDPGALEAVARFQGALHTVEQRIMTRNARRAAPYDYLLPSRILNSASL